jgi:hypothetical protein
MTRYYRQATSDPGGCKHAIRQRCFRCFTQSRRRRSSQYMQVALKSFKDAVFRVESLTIGLRILVR